MHTNPNTLNETITQRVKAEADKYAEARWNKYLADSAYNAALASLHAAWEDAADLEMGGE